MSRTDAGSQEPDILDLAQSTRELDRLSIRLCGMVADVGDAKMVSEYDAERRKAALSRAVMKAFKEGADSTAKAEHMARTSPAYEADLRTLANNLANAEKVRTDYETLKIRIDALRSRISATKSAIHVQ
jgi:hypothetical protein